MRPQPIQPGPGQESVWDYPRPPRLEPVPDRLRVVFADRVIADTQAGYRVLETSHPPTYYLPPADIEPEVLQRTTHQSGCEWKGRAHYFDIVVGDRFAKQAAWGYSNPTRPFAALQDFVSFYAEPMDACYVGDHLVEPQPGNFYGGWVTPTIVGPFKGSPGTWGW
ncbi:DUF427 domain-containing protein [Mucisphaera sp.]|uniref:DUF427 domain-containing protein n=1 Tax=Mucisphaera sp. TaxID=2913024 RepID=UPI003D0F8CE2